VKRRPLFILLGCLFLAALSCTRMPTAPRREVLVEGTIAGPDGAPVRYADVIFYARDAALPQNDDPPPWARADVNGHYSIRLTSGLYEVHIPPPRGGWIGYSNLVSITSDNRIIDYAFHGLAVTGRLLDPEGVSVPGYVEATLEGRNPSTGYTYADSNGFSFLLPPGTYSFKIEAFRGHDALATTIVHSIPVFADTALDLHFVGIPVQGTVIGRDGQPLQYAGVDAYPTLTYTDADGHYRLFTPSGVHALRCFSSEPGTLPRLVTLAISAPITLDFDFRGNLYWSGQVLNASDQTPVAGYLVVADVHGADNRTAHLETDADGRFHLYVEPKLSYDLQVFTSWYDETPIYTGVFRATADTTFQLLVVPPPPESGLARRRP
jgi:hypothetical protein